MQRPDPAPWWQGATFYQIYPRSFYDANGDGTGDLLGVMQKLDHVAELGVDGIWLSPFYSSPMRDFGYDVLDHCTVDPVFGSLDDFDRLLARAHLLGLKVLIDMVWSHTAIEHEWFSQSRASRDGPKADWYVCADARPTAARPPTGRAGWAAHMDLGRRPAAVLPAQLPAQHAGPEPAPRARPGRVPGHQL